MNTARMPDKSVRCDWCHVYLADPRGLAAHKSGLACKARGTNRQLLANGWQPVGVLTDSAIDALQKAGIEYTCDYAGTFSAGFRGRPAVAPRTHYIKDTWAIDLWRAIAKLSGARRQAAFVYIAQHPESLAIVQSVILLGGVLDSAFFRHLQAQFPGLQAAIDAAKKDQKTRIS